LINLYKGVFDMGKKDCKNPDKMFLINTGIVASFIMTKELPGAVAVVPVRAKG